MSRSTDRAAATRASILASPPTVLIVLLVAVRVFVLLVTIRVAHSPRLDDGDIIRFEQIATTEGRPYRDFAVEYAPLELATIRAVGGDGVPTTATRVAVLWLICDLSTAAALAWGWGKTAAATYLVIGLPMLPLMSLRLDPVSVLLAVGGFALIRHRREASGGALIGAAVLFKLWPLLLVPALVLRGRRRALVWLAFVTAGGVLVWLAFGGIRAPWQVLSFRGATGWHIQSLIGAVIWIVTGGPVRSELNAIRIGTIPAWARLGLIASTIAVVVGVWWHARRWRGSAVGRPATAAIALVIALSPVFSSQYVSWLVPWAAIDRDRDGPGAMMWVVFAISVLTGILFSAYAYGRWEAVGPHIPVIKATLVVIGGLCLSLPVLWLRTPTRD